MDDGEMLLRAILDNPAEDTPRLAYADWLDEQGEELRAEFVRVQCEVAVLEKPGSSADPRAKARSVKGKWSWECPNLPRLLHLRKRASELWSDNAADWMPFLPGASQFALNANSEFIGRGPYAVQFGAGNVDGLGRVEMLWTRGFCSHVVASAADWLAHADLLTASGPVERVRLTTWPELVREPLGRDGWAGALWSLPRRHYKEPADDPCDSGMASRLLRVEWPRIQFQLPERRVAPDWAISDLLVNPPPR